MICVFACKKTESPIVLVPIAPIVQEETIKFTTNLDSGINNIIDTLYVSLSVFSKLPSSGIIISININYLDSSKNIFKIDSSISQSSFSIRIPGLNKTGNYSINLYVSSKSNNTNNASKSYTYNQLLEINSSVLLINNSQKDDIWKGMDIAFNGAVDFISKSGSEMIILTPSISKSPLPIIHLPTLSLLKSNNKFNILNYFSNVNMGMGGRDVEKFTDDGFVWADTGEEPIGVSSSNDFPFGNVWVASNLNNNDIKWVKANQSLSFYHSVYSGDLNHDGFIDIAAIHAGTRGPVEDRIHTFINNRDNTFSQKQIILPSASTGCAYDTAQKSLGFPKCPSWSSSAIIVDTIDKTNGLVIIKSDGVHFGTDIVQHSFEVYYDPQKNGIYDVLKFNPLIGLFLKRTDLDITRMKLFDYDKDGRKDIFALFQQNTSGLSNYAALQIFHNEGNGVFFATDNIIEFQNDNLLVGEFDFIDVDNNGALDLVFNSFKDWSNPNKLIYDFKGDGTVTNFDNSATVDFDQLIYYNNNGKFEKREIGYKKNIPNGAGIVWIKGFKVANRFKFICLQKTGNYIRSNLNWDPNTWKINIIEAYPKF